MSTFSMIGTAYSGLNAARAALEVTGQNVANVSTPGYTRQRVDQVALAGVSNTSLYTTGLNIGSGTAVIGISRLNDSIVDANVSNTVSTSNYWSTASSALSTVETSLNEPSDNGLSETLNQFWSAWQGMSNAGGSASTASTTAATALLAASNTLTSRISAGYGAAQTAWSDARSATASTVATVNDTAKQIATLNDSILRTVSSGGNANELMDQRSASLTTLAGLTGATARQNANGTIDVVLGGNMLVSGSATRTVALVGAQTLQATGAGNDPSLQFTDNGATVSVTGGTVAAQLATLAGAAGGTGGTYAEAAAAYDSLATTLMDTVNAVHEQGASYTGATDLKFFDVKAGGTPATGLYVVPTSTAGIATAATTAATTPGAAATTTGATAHDGSIADRISQLGAANDAPDSQWAAFVAGIGAQSKAAASQSTIAGSAATAAVTAQTSQSGVDLDEETSNLVVFQHAYQGAARVMTAIDQMLDTLINHTGVVGLA